MFEDGGEHLPAHASAYGEGNVRNFSRECVSAAILQLPRQGAEGSVRKLEEGRQKEIQTRKGEVKKRRREIRPSRKGPEKGTTEIQGS